MSSLLNDTLKNMCLSYLNHNEQHSLGKTGLPRHFLISVFQNAIAHRMFFPANILKAVGQQKLF